ncbi:MAG: site-specific integrase [Defluviitaleaceae bacterium]|nr:site-specific integrase [Defluviitaleaceae bacterium]
MATITKRGKSFLVQVSMPDGKGGYIRKSSTYKSPLGSTPTQTKRGADAYAIEFENKCRGLTNYNENMTLDELQTWYMSDIAPNRLKGSTQDINTRVYEYYLHPLLGRRKLKDLTPVVLDTAFRQIQESGGIREYWTLISTDTLKDALHAVGGSYRKMAVNGIISVDRMTLISRGGRTFKDKAQAISDYCKMPIESLFTPEPTEPLNSNTAKKIQSTLGALLSTATQKGIISNNPMLHVEPIKATETKRAVMNAEQAHLFLARLEKLENMSVRALLLTALFTGARSGELRALKWADVDTQQGLINISKSIDAKNRITTPKTKKSTRIIQIDFRLAAFLEHYYCEQQAYIDDMRGRIADNGIVFPAITTGDYMNRHYPNSVIKGLIRDTDIPQGLHIHSLRHSFTSIMINDGADAKLVQSALGHSRLQTTMDVYGTIFAETLAKSMQGVSFTLTNGGNIFGITKQEETICDMVK